jgi:hypothetical protein
LIAEVNPRVFQRSPSAMDDFMLPLPGLAPIRGKPVVARFDEECLSSTRACRSYGRTGGLMLPPHGE